MMWDSVVNWTEKSRLTLDTIAVSLHLREIDWVVRATICQSGPQYAMPEHTYIMLYAKASVTTIRRRFGRNQLP